MKRLVLILSMVGAFAVGMATARAKDDDDHEHDYRETVYQTSQCCLFYEEYDCEEDGDTRACRRRCASQGKKMKQYERCPCGVRRFVSATECSSNL